MKINVNENFNNLSKNYLFSEINIRVKNYLNANPNAKIIRLGIGDVTKPIVPACIKAMQKFNLKEVI